MKKLIIIICAISLLNCKENKISKEEKKLVNVDKDSISKKSSDIDKGNKIVNKDTLKAFFKLDSARILEDYKQNISKVKEVLKRRSALGDIGVESIIPISSEEFRFFYGLTYSTEDDWNFFERINTLIIRKSQSNVGNCMYRYSNLAEFVDGEYAEGFYDDILFIAERNSNRFCEIFDNLSTISKKNLLDVYNEVCKDIELKNDEQ